MRAVMAATPTEIIACDSADADDVVDNPTDPIVLTDEQASRGVQFFFRPANGYFEARLGAVALGIGGTCASGGEFLFAGDSALCAPPPPRHRPRAPDHA